jgi:hypothetical protein
MIMAESTAVVDKSTTSISPTNSSTQLHFLGGVEGQPNRAFARLNVPNEVPERFCTHSP